MASNRWFAILILVGLSPALVCMLGCDDRQSSKPSAKGIDPNTIQQGPILHDVLSDPLLARIKKVHVVFADVDGTSLDKWIDDFKRDLDPEGNVKIWEDMTVAYESFCKDRGLEVEVRKEVFKVVLLRSMLPDSEVLTRLELKHLSTEDAKAIMASYPSKPEPITVISK